MRRKSAEAANLRKAKAKSKTELVRAFPGSPGVKNQPCKCRMWGSILVVGTNIPHAKGQLEPEHGNY